jgi:hypothetical protein
MKTIKIIYWISTILIVALMVFSAISSFLPNPDGEKMMNAMGYHAYVFHFLAVAKILGAIAILMPGFPRLKEWAYAGYAFDLIGATYSMYASGFPFSQWAMMFVFIAILFVSYIYYHKKEKAPAVKDAAV